MDGHAVSRIARLSCGGTLLWVGAGRLLYPASLDTLLGDIGTPSLRVGLALVLGFAEALTGLLLLSGLALRPALRACRLLAIVPATFLVAFPSQTLVGGGLPVLTATGQALAARAALLLVGATLGAPEAGCAARAELRRAEREREGIFGGRAA
jgi:hypothetical protein